MGDPIPIGVSGKDPGAATGRMDALRALLQAAGQLVPRALWSYLSAQILNQVLLLSADVLISRALGPHDRGLWFGLLTVLLLVAGIMSFALPMSCYFQVGNLKTGIDRVNNACLLFILLALPALAVSGHFLQGLAIFRGLPRADTWVLGCASLVCFEIYVLCWYGIMMGLGEVTSVIFINLASSAVFLLTIAFLAGLRRIDLTTVFFSYFAYRLVLASFFLIYCGRRSTIRLQREWNLLWRMFSFGARGQPGNFFTMGFLRAVFFYLYRFRGAFELGIFGIAYDLSGKFSFMTNAVQFVFTRSIVGSTLGEAKERTRKLVRAMLLGYGALSLPICAAAVIGIPLFYGEKYRAAVGIFLVLSVGAFLNSANQILGVYINGRLGRPGINSIIAFFALLFAASFGFRVVQEWGLYGAATTISLTYLLQLAAALAVFRRAKESPRILEPGLAANLAAHGGPASTPLLGVDPARGIDPNSFQ